MSQEIDFTRVGRRTKAGQSVVATSAQSRRAVRATETQIFIQSTLNKINQILSLYNLSDALRYDMANSVEGLDDLLNLNPGMVAAALVFFKNTQNKFSATLFHREADGLLRVLIDHHHLSSEVEMDEEERMNAYKHDLLRYLFRIGSAFSVQGIPDLF